MRLMFSESSAARASSFRSAPISEVPETLPTKRPSVRNTTVTSAPSLVCRARVPPQPMTSSSMCGASTTTRSLPGIQTSAERLNTLDVCSRPNVFRYGRAALLKALKTSFLMDFMNVQD